MSHTMSSFQLLDESEFTNKENKPQQKTIADFQAEIAEWSKKNFPSQDPIDPLLGISEEVGELNHAVLKARQGIRKGADPQLTQELINDALADLFIYMADFASRNNISLGEVIAIGWATVKQRDWQRNKVDGITTTASTNA